MVYVFFMSIAALMVLLLINGYRNKQWPRASAAMLWIAIGACLVAALLVVIWSNE